MDKDFNIIGKPVIRQDGIEKVTGAAKYADDINLPNQLYGVMVRIPSAHAEINKIDYSKIINDPAIADICDANDIPGTNIVGALIKDQPIFSEEKVVTPGDVVAMLIGESENDLLQLREKVVVRYKELPVLTDPLKAMDKNSVLIHPERKNNLICHYPLRKGNIEKGFAESDQVIERTYTTPLHEHAYIEPECVIANLKEGDKGITVTGSIQNPHTTRKIVAAVLNWPLAKVRIVQAELGGSFGGKDDTMNILAARAAVAAIKTKRPVKIRYKREDSILESYKRHPYIMKYKVGFNNDGKLKAFKIDITADGGAYASMSPFVTWRTVVQATGPYEVENVWTDVKAVYTNNPYTGAFRGFGSPQPIFAQESLMDEIAEVLGISPIEIRKINGFKSGAITASGQKLEKHDVNLLAVMEEGARESNFKEKWKNYKSSEITEPFFTNNNFKAEKSSILLNEEKFISPENLKSKGIGLAASFRGCALGAEGVDAAAAYLSVQADGSAYLLSGLAENGQGLRTTFSIIAAEVLGITPEHIVYLEQDTGIVPDSGPTVASRSTLMGGGAVKNAAEILKNRFEEMLIKHWILTSYDKLLFVNNMVTVAGKPKLKMSFSDACSLAYSQGISLAAMGWYSGPKVGWDEETGQGDAYFTYVYSCHIAEVEVNRATGEVYIENIWAVHDSGKIINILGAQGQVYGGVTQGAGYGIWEEVESNKGFIRELNFDQYIIPTSKDVGNIYPIFVEGKDPYGAWGAKSLGEPAIELTSAAIANAIFNATGKRGYNLPINLEELLLNRKLKPEDLKRGSAS